MPKGAQNRKKTRKFKQESGMNRVIDKKESFQKDWDLDWFTPSDTQYEIVNSVDRNYLTVIQGASGTGKSAVTMWKALQEYRQGNYSQIILIKNPAESGDDKIGFLKGDEQDKLKAHMDAMETIFHQFISKNKLEVARKSENICLTIPNYIQGKTFDNAFIIIEEAQNMSPSTLKLCMERAGTNSTIVVLGDRKQTYAVSRRNDGLSDLVNRLCTDEYGARIVKLSHPPGYVGYVELTSKDNQRSEISRFITDLYDDD